MARTFRTSLVLAGLGVALTLSACEDPPVDTVQRGYRGLAMEQNYNPEDFSQLIAANQAPEPLDAAPEGGDLAGDVYENVEVLGDLRQPEFTRLMNAMTQWVAPEQGCGYCHNLAQGFAYEDVYTKKVSRMMLRMTRNINANWTDHVQDTGVTCYTCHRGQNVPEYVWWKDTPEDHTATGMAGNRFGQNAFSETVAYSSLPNSPFENYLLDDWDIQVQGDTVLPAGNRNSTKRTEHTYGLMMHMSDSLGVNCTYCHNSRSWNSWEQSTPQRVSAWHGIRMVREANNEYVVPTTGWLPEKRLGPTGDAPKVNCTTCHQGVYKPLFGANMTKDYPNLSPGPQQEASADGGGMSEGEAMPDGETEGDEGGN